MSEPAVLSDSPSQESDTPAAAGPVELSAGQLLRQAREATGMHIAALSVALKVPVRKLELLEADAHDQLPGATFTRALAKSVCRALKIDSEPVLARMPGRQDAGLNHAVLGGARRDAFATAPAAAKPGGPALPKPMAALAAAIVLVAAALLVLPSVPSWPSWADLWSASPDTPVAGTAAPNTPVAERPANPGPVAALAVAALQSPASSEAAVAPPRSSGEVTIARSEPVGAAAAVASPEALQLKSTAPSWIEVRDGGGAVVFSGTVSPGVPAIVDLRGNGQLVVGNAAATEVLWRGRVLDVAAASRDNVARLELK